MRAHRRENAAFFYSRWCAWNHNDNISNKNKQKKTFANIVRSYFYYFWLVDAFFFFDNSHTNANCDAHMCMEHKYFIPDHRWFRWFYVVVSVPDWINKKSCHWNNKLNICTLHIKWIAQTAFWFHTHLNYRFYNFRILLLLCGCFLYH